MAELMLIDFLRRRSLQRAKWSLIDRDNPFELDEEIFIRKFRLSRQATMDLAQELKQFIPIRPNGYAVEMQLLIALRIYATGSFQSVLADGIYSRVAQSSVSRFLSNISTALIELTNKYIQFPISTNLIGDTRMDFYSKFRFPNLIGVIDCTHITIQKPSTSDWFTFLNRKGKFSLNIQMVCNSNMEIIDVVARWPGCTHDSFIWHMSGLRNLLSTNTQYENMFLIGDSGYPLEPWLLTPYADPNCPRERTYNKKFRQTRNIIERCFGVLKGRFRILDQTGGTLLYSPSKVAKMVMGLAVLHNICIKYRVEFNEFENDDVSVDDPDDRPQGNTNMYAAAVLMRDRIATNFHANV